MPVEATESAFQGVRMLNLELSPDNNASRRFSALFDCVTAGFALKAREPIMEKVR